MTKKKILSTLRQACIAMWEKYEAMPDDENKEHYLGRIQGMADSIRLIEKVHG